MENRKLCLAYLSGIKKDTREQGGGARRVGGEACGWEKIAGIKKDTREQGGCDGFFWGG